MEPSLEILRALHFAADKHRKQRRKGADRDPYINHPIAVAEVLAREAGVRSAKLLQAAVLHDTIEDTETTPEELERHFGRRVRRLVEEVTDDKKLPSAERKRLQIEHAPKLSKQARRIKLADKICNLRDLAHTPPKGWNLERRIRYLEWSRQVVAGCRGASPKLERLFDRTLRAARAAIDRELGGGHEVSAAARGTLRRRRPA
jgi:guanosine-3',5'-bis(diphosphate) 3'-pyrophosphohydrolase